MNTDPQAAITAFVEQGSGHALILAAPGSGKTHALVNVAVGHPQLKIRALAFNRHNAAELEARMPRGCDVRTLHSLAVQTLYRTGLRFSPCPSLLSSAAQELHAVVARNASRLAPALYRQAIQTLAARYNAYLLAGLQHPESHYPPVPGLESSSDMLLELHAKRVQVYAEHATQSRAANKASPTPGSKIDSGKPSARPENANPKPLKLSFTETLYYALKVLEEKPGAAPHLTLLDELQDSSPLSLALVVASLGTSGRLLAVGDPRQNIMGFAGAAREAFAELREQLERRFGTRPSQKTIRGYKHVDGSGVKAQTRPKRKKGPPTQTLVTSLSLGKSHRVPERHAELANHVFEHEQHRYEPFAGNGTRGWVSVTDRTGLNSLLECEDRVLCRFSAPLISLTLELEEARLTHPSFGPNRAPSGPSRRLGPNCAPSGLGRPLGPNCAPSELGRPPVRLRLGSLESELKRVWKAVSIQFETPSKAHEAKPYFQSSPAAHPSKDDLRAAIKSQTVETAPPSQSPVSTNNPVLEHPSKPENALESELELGPLELIRTLLLGLVNLESGVSTEDRRILERVDAALSRLLSPEPGILLSTIHGAKGSEARRVFVLQPTRTPRPRVGDDPLEEDRLRFVAFTRAKESLVLVPQVGEDLSALFPDGFILDPAPTASLTVPKVNPNSTSKRILTPTIQPLHPSSLQGVPELGPSTERSLGESSTSWTERHPPGLFTSPLIHQTLERRTPFEPSPPFDLPRLSSSVHAQTPIRSSTTGHGPKLASDTLLPSTESAVQLNSTPARPSIERRPTSLQGLLFESQNGLESERGELERLEATLVQFELQPPDTPLHEFSIQHYQHLIAGAKLRIKKWVQKVYLYRSELNRSAIRPKIPVS